MRGLEQEFSGRITFVRVNIHNKETLPLQEKYGFTATPEFFLVDANGNIMGHWDEGMTVAGLGQTISALISARPPK